MCHFISCDLLPAGLKDHPLSVLSTHFLILSPGDQPLKIIADGERKISE